MSNLLKLKSNRKELYIVYYDTLDDSIHLDIKGQVIEEYQRKNYLTIPLLLKTLATSFYMLSADYFQLLSLQKDAQEKKAKEPQVKITDRLIQ